MQFSISHILQIPLIKVYPVIPFSRNLHNTETRQLIWKTNKVTNLYTMQVLAKGYFLTGYINLLITHPLSQYNNNSNNNDNNDDDVIMMM